MSKENLNSEEVAGDRPAAAGSELPGDYVPYGPEWAKELSRLTKPQIIGMYRSALIDMGFLRDGIECASNALTDSICVSGNDHSTNMHFVRRLRGLLSPNVPTQAPPEQNPTSK